MGLDAEYQAIPADSRILDRLREDLRMEGMAGTVLWEMSLGKDIARGPRSDDPAERAVEEYVFEMFSHVHDVSERSFSLERVWDTMNYCLSARRREEPGADDDDLMDIAIRGEQSVAPHVFALQGGPLKHTSPETVKRIARHLETLPFDTLLRQFAPQLLHGEQYKGPSSESREWYCGLLREYFTGFRAFYQTAASHGDRVLVLID